MGLRIILQHVSTISTKRNNFMSSRKRGWQKANKKNELTQSEFIKNFFNVTFPVSCWSNPLRPRCASRQPAVIAQMTDFTFPPVWSSIMFPVPLISQITHQRWAHETKRECTYNFYNYLSFLLDFVSIKNIKWLGICFVKGISGNTDTITKILALIRNSTIGLGTIG